MKRGANDWSWADRTGGSSSHRAMAPMPGPDAEGVSEQLTLTISHGYLHHWEIPDTVAQQVLKKIGMAGDRRNLFAQCIFPYRPDMGSKGLWQKQAGEWVAYDIKHAVELRDRMCKLHYKPRVTGYTMDQMLELTKFYLWKGKLTLPKGR